MKRKIRLSVILISILLIVTQNQTSIFTILPNEQYNQATPSAQACLATCQSCQVNSNACEDCYSPYFIKALDGSCTPAPGYTIESSTNQILTGDALIYDSNSWTNGKVTECLPSQNLTNPLKIQGPFTSVSTPSYQRTLSLHDYIIVKFLLVKMNWDTTSVLNIKITNENGNIILSQNIVNNGKIPLEKLCSNTMVDQRYSVNILLKDQLTTRLFIYFNLTGSTTSSFGIATFLVLTGLCDSHCQDCNFVSSPDGCTSCRSFLQLGSDKLCSVCANGFKYINSTQSCQKCPIEYENCALNSQLCFYNTFLSSQLNQQCKFNSKAYYNDTKDVDSLNFPGSLFTVEGKPANYKCGSYSIVGLAQRGDFITRIFASFPTHTSISITFNIFLVDMPALTSRNIFIIMLDNIVLEATFVNFNGLSNLCGKSDNETIQTYQATRFYAHTNTQSINLTITSDAVNWGIRNLRLAYQVCDSSCLLCGDSGCLKCPQYFQTSSLSCTGCLPGYAFATVSNKSTCIMCEPNCLECTLKNIGNVSNSYCLVCGAAYFIYEGDCVLRTNVGVNMSISGENNTWKIINSANETGTLNTSCAINLNNYNGIPTAQNFIISQNKLSNQVKIARDHYKKIVQFYLIKIDDWNVGDQLNLYLNDLLVLSKTYTAFGNNVCFNSDQSDFISFESIQIIDNNSSLSISFEVVSIDSNIKRFGISNFRVYGVGCTTCLNYDFNYKIDYNYDQSLKVRVAFNRVFECNNNTLFQTIFHLYINGKQTNYSIYFNNGVVYILETKTKQDLKKGNITLICRYPELVTTDVTATVNSQPFFTVRLLQTYSTKKIINTTSATTIVDRYYQVTNQQTIDGIRIFFEVVSRIVIYLGFAFFFIGCQTSCTHMMHNLQKLWIHIFVASLAIPSIFKFSLQGFRQVQNQNIAINPTEWEKPLPVALYYDAPAYFQQYYTDIAFLRNIYNIGLAFAILVIFVVVMYFVMNKCNFGDKPFTKTTLFRHLYITYGKSPFFAINSIIFYQYLTLVLACTLQFIDLLNNTNQGSFTGASATGSIVAFIIATIYPLAHFGYLQYKQTDLGAAKRIQYSNRYHEIFFRFVPQNLWSQNEPISIGYAERIYNLFRFGQIWWMCIIVTLIYSNPQGQCYLLIITNAFHLIIVLFSSLNRTIYFRILKTFELAFFIGIQIIILVCQSNQDTLITTSLNTLGSVGISLVFGIITLSLIRSVYTFFSIYSEYRQEDKLIINNKLRNEEYYSSNAGKDYQAANSEN